MRVICLAIFVSGCQSHDVHPKDVANAEKACTEYGRWVAIDTSWKLGNKEVNVQCHDGTYVREFGGLER